MNVLVLGEGYLGTRLAHDLPNATLRAADIANPLSVRAVLSSTMPDVVINAAGKTGKPNVDWCETNRVETYRSNAVGPLVLAEECAKQKIRLVHLGSGCIFYGESPQSGGWFESDFANPVGYYSKTKYASDLAIGDLPHVSVVRLRMPIDGTPHARNLITKLVQFRQVVDVTNSVTVVQDLVDVVKQVAARKLSGIFHAVNPGTISHPEIIQMYRKIVDSQHRCEFISENELVRRGLVAIKRSNCVLQNTRLPVAGIFMRPVKEAVQDAMMQYAKAARKK